MVFLIFGETIIPYCYAVYISHKDQHALVKKCQKHKIKHYERVIAICDADFDHLNNRPAINSVFLTDTHDSETLVIQAIGIDVLIAKHGTDDFKDALRRNLLKNSLKLAYDIGLLKWLNSTHHLKLNFKALDYENFITFKVLSGQLNLDELIEQVLTQSNSTKSKDWLIAEVNKLAQQNASQLQVSNGHDISSIMVLILDKFQETKDEKITLEKLEQANIESDLSLSYNIENFKKTNLYQQLKSWQTDNQMPQIIE